MNYRKMKEIRGKPGLGKAYLFAILIFLGMTILGFIIGILLISPAVIILGIIIGAIVSNVYFWGKLGKKLDR